MKIEARDKAVKMFVKAKGKITNKQIADKVKVNPLTIGRWKKADKWDAKLRQARPAPKKPSGVVRKKAARDKALTLFLDSEGTVTNKELADRVKVSPATISKWKEQDKWAKKVVPGKKAVRVPRKQEQEQEKETEPELSMGELASAEQIIRINERIEELLKRDHLTAGEVAELASAKRDMLDAVELYVAIARELGVIKV